MQDKWPAYLDRNNDFPEVQHALKSAKSLTDTKEKFLKQLLFEAEPTEFGKVLSDYNLKKLCRQKRRMEDEALSRMSLSEIP